MANRIGADEPFARRMADAGEMMLQMDEAIDSGNLVRASVLSLQISGAMERLLIEAGKTAPEETLNSLGKMLNDLEALAEKSTVKEQEMRAKGQSFTGYSLINVDTIAHEEPSFQIPSKERRLNLSIGDTAKLVFMSPLGKRERMWVQVTKVIRPGRYVGKLDNHPALLKMFLEYGDQIQFSYENVSDIMPGGN